MVLAGFFFWFIILTNIISDKLGHETFSDLNSDAKLQKINKDTKKFKIGVALALLEHVGIISVAFMLFLAFSSKCMILAVIWTICRSAEGLIQIYYKKDYWRLLNIARQYSGSSGSEKDRLECPRYQSRGVNRIHCTDSGQWCRRHRITAPSGRPRHLSP